MPIQKLDFAEPFYSLDYVTNEPVYHAAGKCMIINLAEHEHENLYIKGVVTLPLKASVVKDVDAENVVRALIVKDIDKVDLNDIATIKKIKSTWKTLYEMSGMERHKGLPYYKSPKFRIGDGRDRMELNFCFVSEPFAPSGPHQTHDRNFDEVHAQIAGYGKMRVFETPDYDTFYKELPMSPGTVHDKMYAEDGSYPWHEYQSVTPCIYCPIELDRE
ncbi:MAG: hypothetical protein Q4C53_00730 [Clostridia bacterium]|nr:hypothetical protein [Clostridia bacterium]